MVLDGEAAPAGGLGIARQTKDEYQDPPPTCVVIARAADRWLAAFAQVDATLVHPLDPVTTGRTIAAMLRAQPGRRRPARHHRHDRLSLRTSPRTPLARRPPWANAPGRTC